jgi:hypothetical protein
MRPQDDGLMLEEPDFAPAGDELGDDAAETAAELERLLHCVQAARFSGA